MKKIVLLFISLMLIGCTTTKDTSSVKPFVRIGFVGPLTGDLERFGISELEAVKDVIQEYSDRLDIELVALDDQCRPELAKMAAIEMVNSNVDFVIGHVCSGTTLTALPIYAKNCILCITSSATNPDINRSGEYSNFFRTIPNDYAQSKKIIEFATKNGMSNLLVVYELGDYSKMIMTGIKNENDVLNIQYVAFDTSNKNLYDDKTNKETFQSFIVKAEMIVYCGYYADFSDIYQYLRNNLNFTGMIVGTDGVHDEALFATNINYENTYTINADDFSQFKEVKNIQQHYAMMYKKEPGPFYERTYMATDMVLNLICKNKSLLTFKKEKRLEELRAILIEDDIDTVFGIRHFDESGDLEENDFSVYRIVNNRFEAM